LTLSESVIILNLILTYTWCHNVVDANQNFRCHNVAVDNHTSNG
jgi:hypothetical protein